jgi:hypothetical protein
MMRVGLVLDEAMIGAQIVATLRIDTRGVNGTRRLALVQSIFVIFDITEGHGDQKDNEQGTNNAETDEEKPSMFWHDE